MKILFWTLTGLIIYCYFGYPLLLSLLARFGAPAIRKAHNLPTVSVVLSVWNEEDVIEAKIGNLLALDYPSDKIEVLIGSDGSTDKTDEIIKKVGGERVKLVQGPERKGKMATINALVRRAENEIILFTDARQIFEKNAVKELVANFADPAVGCVSGELVFSKKDGATARGINLYWNYEKFIRSRESKIHSMLGATGAIYAIRKELFTDVPEDVVLDDMFIPFKIIQKGYRAVFDETAKAYDEVADSPKEEHRRKTRTLFGNYQIFSILPGMFIPFKSPVAAQLFSHKLLRVLIPFFMIAVFFINLALLRDTFYKTILVGQIIFYFMAILGALARYKKYGMLKAFSRASYVPYMFCLLNFSALIGFLKFIGQGQKATWQKARGSER